MEDESIINKVFPINERVDIKYTIDKEYTDSVTSSPQVKLSVIEEKEEVKTEIQDNTTKDTSNPPTGDSILTYVIMGILLVLGSSYTYKKIIQK